MVFKSTILLGFLLSFIGLDEAMDTTEVMLKVTDEFGKAIYYCQGQMGFSDDVILKIRHFWHADYAGTPQETACVIRCAIKRLELMDEQENLIHANVVAFVKAKGADNATAQRLLDIVTKECPHHKPRSNIANVPENCLKAMATANCLRTGVLKMHLKPKLTKHLIT